MQYVQLIYNPFAGQRVFGSRLDFVIDTFQKEGYDVRIRRTMSPEDFSDFFEGRDFSDCVAVLIAGGDGSFSKAVNAMKRKQMTCPVGVLPAGTANDFARHLGIPDSISEAVPVMARLDSRKVDLGEVNGTYFVNVCSGGLLTSISHSVDPELKNTLGVFAYYLKGIQQLHTLRGIPFRIKANNRIYEEDLFLFVVLNGSSAGGFNRIGEFASVKDGRLDFVGLRACPVNDMPIVFAKIMMGEHLNDKNVLYFQSEHIVIECLAEEKHPSVIDGEEGPLYPLDICVHKEELNVLINRKDRE